MRQCDPEIGHLLKVTSLFVAILHLLQLLQHVLAPLLRYLPALSKRYNFEKLNQSDPLCKAWDGQEKAFWAFHCSSEGEFEQLRPLIMSCLNRQERIELLYTSPSVEKRIHAFAGLYPQNVRILRLPLLSSPKLAEWSQAAGLVMCRYDFFPNLLLLPVQRRVLVWASLKGKKPGLWSKWLYQYFDRVVAATQSEADSFLKLGINAASLETYDFRPSQIQARLDIAQLPIELVKALELVPDGQRLVMGSVWSHDLFLLQEILEKAASLHCWLAPHALSPAALEAFAQDWQQRYPQIPLLRWSRQMSGQGIDSLLQQAGEHEKVAWLLEQPGHLLELYPHFSCAYVGGGFGRSIHSVLEPVMAGCWSMCGPRTHRSSEIDLAQELSPGQIKVIRTPVEFYQWWLEVHERGNALKDDNRSRAIHNWQIRAEEVAGRALAH